MKSSLGIFVFSFNRYDFLQNCVSSIEGCAPRLPLIVMDDNSTDLKTKEYLEKISYKHRIEQNENDKGSEIKTGGLYGAMNKAMSIAKVEGFDYTIFIQDDMQFVRRIADADLEQYAKYFSEIQNSIQLSTSFVRELSADTFFEDHTVSLEANAYLRRRDRESGKSNFSASGVFSVARFHDLFETFEIGEGTNSQKAKKLDLVCGRAIFPSICWLPYPMSYRGKKRSLKHQFFEYFGRSDFHPINLMTETEEERFMARDPRIIPIMERFLISPNAPRHDIWSTGGGEYNFVCFGGIFSKIFVAFRAVKNRNWRN